MLLESSAGEILGGMGGKFNGKHISEASKNAPKEQSAHVILYQQMQRSGRLDDIRAPAKRRHDVGLSI